MNRWAAASIHLAISAIVIGTLFFVLATQWYPFGLFEFASADKLLYLVAGVDIIAGPILTLVIFKSKKPGIKFDIAVITAAQAALLGYGLHVVWQSRPVFLVALPERVELIFANQIEPDALPSTGALPRTSLPWTGPQLVGTEMPTAPAARQALLDALIEGRDLPVFPQYYVPFGQVSEELVAGAAHIDQSAEFLDEIDRNAMIESLGARFRSGARVVPLVSVRGNGVLVIDAESGMPLHAWKAPPTAERNPL